MAEQEFVPKVSRARVDREARSKDFGNMTTRMPKAIVRPKSVEEVCDIVGMAIRDEVELAVRGGGHSQGGQSLTDGGLVIDTMYLNRVQLLESDLVHAQAGA